MLRTVGYHLWGNGAFSLEERKQIVSEDSRDIFHLTNIGAGPSPTEEYAAIDHRIAVTKDRLWQLAT